MAKIKCQIRSEVKGNLVPIYLYYQDSNNHFRIKTDFKVKQEYWNASKEIKSGERLHINHGAHEPVLYTEGTIKNYEGFLNIWNNFQGAESKSP